MDIVVTTIFSPTPGMESLANGLTEAGGTLWILGDRKGPAKYDLPNTQFVSIEQQLQLPFLLVPHLPERHYTRKNLGYLLAIQSGARFLVETDDDNLPLDRFWQPRNSKMEAQRVSHAGWWNVYREFSDTRIWPRGFPLEELNSSFDRAELTNPEESQECLIQQGLADDNPDVDAVYRLTASLPVKFRLRPSVALAAGCWCPFNSQNTTFFAAAFPLLYLPSFCTFRMTDIWRSFVAQRCLWEMNSSVAFTAPTMRQVRNDHDLLRDFEQEIPGYLKNQQIRRVLTQLTLKPGRDRATVCGNLLLCYETLVRHEIFPAKELPLVEAWNRDLSRLS